jgi:hypothetical protein
VLAEMVRSSRAVMLRPSVATFEEYERDQLGWALVYVMIGATIAAVLGWLAFVIHRPFLERQFSVLQSEVSQLEQRFGRDLPIEEFFVPSTAATPIVSNVIGTLIGFLVYLGILFLLGRALGGSGRFGELAYDFSLFWVPITVISAVINVFSIGFFSCFTAPLAVFVTFYGFYLTFLSVQSGLNLTPRKALGLIAIPLLLFVLFFCSLIVLVLSFSN